MMNTNKIKIDVNKLPLILELIQDGIKKEYILKASKDKTGIFVNKIETY